jgi:hypothetical protein
MQQREKEKRKKRKETSNPNVNKNTRLSLTTKQRTLICAKKKKRDPQEREIIKPRKSTPPNYKHI